MTFDLPALAKKQGRRRDITLRPIMPTHANALDLAALTTQAAVIWRERLDLILAGYDPAPLPTGDTLVRDDAGQMSAAIESTAADFLTRLAVIITPGLRRFAARVEQWHRGKWIAAVNAGAGVDLASVLTSLPMQETLEAFVARNVALIRNVSDQAQARISDAVFRGYQNRTPVREVAKELREATDFGRQRAVRIASDQNAKLSAALDGERQAEAGIKKFRYRHSGKLHYRPHHKARNGRIYEWKTRKQVGGSDVIAADDMPGFPPWCACRTQAYLDIMAEIE